MKDENVTRDEMSETPPEEKPLGSFSAPQVSEFGKGKGFQSETRKPAAETKKAQEPTIAPAVMPIAAPAPALSPPPPPGVAIGEEILPGIQIVRETIQPDEVTIVLESANMNLLRSTQVLNALSKIKHKYGMIQGGFDPVGGGLVPVQVKPNQFIFQRAVRIVSTL